MIANEATDWDEHLYLWSGELHDRSPENLLDPLLSTCWARRKELLALSFCCKSYKQPQSSAHQGLYQSTSAISWLTAKAAPGYINAAILERLIPAG